MATGNACCAICFNSCFIRSHSFDLKIECLTDKGSFCYLCGFSFSTPSRAIAEALERGIYVVICYCRDRNYTKLLRVPSCLYLFILSEPYPTLVVTGNASTKTSGKPLTLLAALRVLKDSQARHRLTGASAAVHAKRQIMPRADEASIYEIASCQVCSFMRAMSAEYYYSVLLQPGNT